MRPIFSVHAGEYLVASHIEKKFKGLNVWVPSKDTGIDLLVTNKTNSKTVSLQVKFSKDHLLSDSAEEVEKLMAWGWWSIKPEKLKKSTADLWVLVVMGIHSKKIQYIVVPREELFETLSRLYGSKKVWQVYLKVDKADMCRAERTTPSADKEKCNFTRWLNKWGSVSLLVEK